MSTSLIETPVGRLVAERPSRSRVLERWGLDYCCGGKKLLGEACEEKQIDADAVAREILAADAVIGSPETDWAQEPLPALCDYIVTTHHDYLREALPRLTGLIEKVCSAHGEKHPELSEVRSIFYNFRAELELHMMKEEQILFPLIKRLDAADLYPPANFGSIRYPIDTMEAEHESAGAALARMRELTADYEVPQGACNTYRAMLDGLEELEHDMHRHVHLENNVLFPRAAERAEEAGAF